MSRQLVNIGAVANDGTGDPLRDALDKNNDNFLELYNALGGDTPLTLVNSATGKMDVTGSNRITFLYQDLVDLPTASSYHGMFAHVHNEGAAYYAHAGSWIKLADDSSVPVNIGDLNDVDLSTPATTGQILKYDGTNWVPAADGGASGGGIELTDLSVTVAAAGTANLAYNGTSGHFTYTPPDLSGYQLTSNAFDGDYNSLTNKPTIPSALTDLGISDGTAGQVLKTDGAGNFTFGTITTGSTYGDSDVDTHLNVSSATSGEILSWNGSDYAWVANGSGGGIALTDLSVGAEATADGDGGIAYNNSTGVFTYTPPDLSSYSTFSGAYADLTGKPTIPSSVDDLTDVDITTSAPTDGQALVWDNANSKFIPGTVAAGSSTDTLSDVTARGATTNDAVTINNTLTVTSLDSTGLGFATLTSASDISLNAVGDINANSSKITNVLDPVDLQDAATKNYVDTQVSGVATGVPTFSVTAPDSGRYQFNGAGTDGDDNPTLYLYRGFTYEFNINTPGHPFHIQTSSGAYNASNLYTDNVTNGGTQSGTITWTVQMDSPNTLYYVCQYHSAMNGTINIV